MHLYRGISFSQNQKSLKNIYIYDNLKSILNI